MFGCCINTEIRQCAVKNNVSFHECFHLESIIINIWQIICKGNTKNEDKKKKEKKKKKHKKNKQPRLLYIYIF